MAAALSSAASAEHEREVRSAKRHSTRKVRVRWPQRMPQKEFAARCYGRRTDPGCKMRCSTRFSRSDSATATSRTTRRASRSNRPTWCQRDWKISPWTGDWYARADWEKERGPNFFENGVFDRRYGGDLQGVIEQARLLVGLGHQHDLLQPGVLCHARCTNTTAARFIISIRISVPIRRAI